MVIEMITFVVQQLVSHPHDVVITMVQKEDIDLFEIKVAPEDRGRVIGKEGHTIKALRVLVENALPKDKKIALELSR